MILAEKDKKIIIIDDDDDEVQECKPEDFRSQSRDKFKIAKPNFIELVPNTPIIIKENKETPLAIKDKPTKIIVNILKILLF